MLSRHLYEIDEVVAALMWSCKQRRLMEAAFWCQELIDTDMIEEIYRALYTFWIWQIGIARLDLFIELYILFHREEETSAKDIHQMVIRMANTKAHERDSSIFILLILGLNDKEPIDRTGEVSSLEYFFVSNSVDDHEKAFLRACYQGKARLAWFLSIPLWQKDNLRVWKLLHLCIQQKHPTIPSLINFLQEDECGLSWEVKACAISIACLPTTYKYKTFPSTLISKEIEEALEQWQSLAGRRKRRQYAIPHDCLYFITSRGLLSNKKRNFRKVYCGSCEDLRGSTYWDTLLNEFQPWNSDEQKELFWDTFFPDDIPDEWSLEDQMKSHGYGVLINQEKPNYRKFAEKWFRQNPCSLIWLGSSMAFRILSNITQVDFNSYYSQERNIQDWCITPVIKQIEIISSSS